MADAREGYLYVYESVGETSPDKREAYLYAYENVGRTSPDTRAGYLYVYENVGDGIPATREAYLYVYEDVVSGTAVTGISSGEAWGSPTIVMLLAVIRPAGIASAEAWGAPTIVGMVATGSTSLTGGGTITATGQQALFTQVIGEAMSKKQIRSRQPLVPIAPR